MWLFNTSCWRFCFILSRNTVPVYSQYSKDFSAFLLNSQRISALGFELFTVTLFIYLCLALVDLLCCKRAFCSCGERELGDGYFFVVVLRRLIVVASLVAGITEWILNHWTTRKVQILKIQGSTNNIQNYSRYSIESFSFLSQKFLWRFLNPGPLEMDFWQKIIWQIPMEWQPRTRQVGTLQLSAEIILTTRPGPLGVFKILNCNPYLLLWLLLIWLRRLFSLLHLEKKY